MDRTLCALSVLTDHYAIDILRKARQDLRESDENLKLAKKSLFWTRFIASFPDVVKDIAKRLNVCHCLSCKYLCAGYKIGFFEEVDRQIWASRKSCLLKAHLAGLASECTGLFRYEENVSFFLTLDEDLAQNPVEGFESLDTFLKMVGRIYGFADDFDLSSMKENLASFEK